MIPSGRLSNTQKKENHTITKYSSAYKWYVRVARNLESKRQLSSCRLTVCKYPPVGNSLILIIVQKSRHFKLLIGVSYERMFNWKLTRREPDLCKWHCVFNDPGVWERKEFGKKRLSGTIGKKSAPFSPRTWVLWLVAVVLLCHMDTGLDSIHSLLSLGSHSFQGKLILIKQKAWSFREHQAVIQAYTFAAMKTFSRPNA